MAVTSLEQAGGDRPGAAPRPAAYAWVVFALTFGLLISDYMARQVLNAVFPLLKVEWALTDTQLGALSGVVALMVGLLTFPLSILADRWGWIRSITLMAVLWSIATLVCGMARSYEAMFAGRLLVGIGEAAYGSVGIAVVVSVFPRSMRATLSAAFMAGGLVGQVLGVGLGGHIAGLYGWRTAFIAIALMGLVLALLYPLVVQQRRTSALAERFGNAPGIEEGPPPSLKLLFARRSLICAYVASGLQLYAAGALPAWLPTYFHDYYGLSVSAAAGRAAMFLLAGGAGMVLCAMLSDRLSRHRPTAKFGLSTTYSLLCAIALFAAFLVPPGPLQLAALAFGMFFAAATSGPAGAMVANLTPLRIHGTAFATLTVANNAFGLAAGPMLTGRLADSWGLAGALALLPVPCILAAIIFWIGGRFYPTDLAASNRQA